MDPLSVAPFTDQPFLPCQIFLDTLIMGVTSLIFSEHLDLNMCKQFYTKGVEVWIGTSLTLTERCISIEKNNK